MTFSAVTLRWGVKSSLRRYVSAMPDGSIAAIGPAALDDASRALFPGAWCADEGSTWDGLHVVARFQGSLRFYGHGGLLDLAISEPWLVGSETSFELTIEDPDDVRGRSPMARLAAFSQPIAGESELIDARLTAVGAELFFGNYRAGDELDPLEITSG
jgi:hypothetical protein